MRVMRSSFSNKKLREETVFYLICVAVSVMSEKDIIVFPAGDFCKTAS